ncbi:unnamed protein product, partial [Arabidopsis halleri]
LVENLTGLKKHEDYVSNIYRPCSSLLQPDRSFFRLSLH